MSILIEGVEMPKFGGSVTIRIHGSGSVQEIEKEMICDGYDTSQIVIGTAVKVQPHGDLIERKDAYDAILNGMVITGYQSRALDCIAEYSVPTIIPAEEEWA